MNRLVWCAIALFVIGIGLASWLGSESRLTPYAVFVTVLCSSWLATLGVVRNNVRSAELWNRIDYLWLIAAAIGAVVSLTTYRAEFDRNEAQLAENWGKSSLEAAQQRAESQVDWMSTFMERFDTTIQSGQGRDDLSLADKAILEVANERMRDLTFATKWYQDAEQALDDWNDTQSWLAYEHGSDRLEELHSYNWESDHGFDVATSESDDIADHVAKAKEYLNELEDSDSWRRFGDGLGIVWSGLGAYILALAIGIRLGKVEASVKGLTSDP